MSQLIMKKLVRVIRPKEKHGLYKVIFDHGDGVLFPCYMNEYSYKVFQLKMKLVEQGAKGGLIEDFQQAVSEETEHDRDCELGG